MGANQGQQYSFPGTQSPATAVLQQLFGGNVRASHGQFTPTSFGQGGVFDASSFSALPGLLQNMPATGIERGIAEQGQGFGLNQALLGNQLLNTGGQAAQELLQGPQAQIAQARRDFSQETLPAILERAPGFSSSDLQRELTRAGTDLDTNVAALREQNLGQMLNLIPGYAQAQSSQLLDSMANVLGFGQIGRDFLRETSEAGDAFRVLSAFQSLTTPALTNYQQSRNKSGGI